MRKHSRKNASVGCGAVVHEGQTVTKVTTRLFFGTLRYRVGTWNYNGTMLQVGQPDGNDTNFWQVINANVSKDEYFHPKTGKRI